MGLFSVKPAHVRKETRQPHYSVPQEEVEPPTNEETHDAWLEEESRK